jgi:hypothetical protein
MIQKTTKAPSTQRRFGNVWSELDYLCKKIAYWLYEKKQKAKGLRYHERLDRVLNNLPDNDAAILREEGLALLHELQGGLGKAIIHRQREIMLMERLHKEALSSQYAESTRAYMLRGRDAKALRQRRKILETLQNANNESQARNGRGIRSPRRQPRG